MVICMQETYLGRQPIYDSALHVEGYRLSCHPVKGGDIPEDAHLLDIELMHSRMLFNPSCYLHGFRR